MPRYSEMTPAQLEREMEQLQQEGRQAFDRQDWSRYAVAMQKWYLAKSYLIRDQIRIEPGRVYDLAEEPDRLTVTRVEGVMAWGIRFSDGSETAVPLAMLVIDGS
ncbi:MAG: YfhH family protein [Alicyclobacillus macrosporangiidus]|uniref:DUF1811 family protein n=1 Tax=Alicyclobacillus macrosporangiidus TaxID=392015 RepID=UPI0026EBF0AD|nr:DUF1811 family protein [Alicyclobacillus macrosporangiidus]MCL6599098.1 YfhH family protein [Alicyclobacillus macrosporangiidus]